MEFLREREREGARESALSQQQFSDPFCDALPAPPSRRSVVNIKFSMLWGYPVLPLLMLMRPLDGKLHGLTLDS